MENQSSKLSSILGPLWMFFLAQKQNAKIKLVSHMLFTSRARTISAFQPKDTC